MAKPKHKRRTPGKRKTRAAVAAIVEAAADRPTSRARTAPIGNAADAKTKEARVLYIARMMARGAWRGYPSREWLAEAWDLTESTLRDYAAEAHRVVAFDPAEREQLKRSLASLCQRILRKAEREVNQVTGKPDYRDALAAVDSVAKFAGIELEPVYGAGTGGGPAVKIVLAEDDDGKDEPGADGPT